MEYPVTVVRASRRTILLTVVEGPRVLLKVPRFLSSAETAAFLEKHRIWIEKHAALVQERQKNARRYTPEEVTELRRRAGQIAADGVARYAPRMRVVPTGIRITSAAKRWGSCSGRNSLCFSWHIALLPPEAADYIVVHELAHILQKNHGPKFYREVEKILPDYKARIEMLKKSQIALGL